MGKKILWEEQVKIDECLDIPSIEGILKKINELLEKLKEEADKLIQNATMTAESFVNLSLQAPGRILNSLPVFARSIPGVLEGVAASLGGLVDDLTPDITIGTPRIRLPEIRFPMFVGVHSNEASNMPYITSDYGIIGRNGCVVHPTGIKRNEKSLTLKEAYKIINEAIKAYKKMIKALPRGRGLTRLVYKALKKGYQSRIKELESIKANLNKQETALKKEYTQIKNRYNEILEVGAVHQTFLTKIGYGFENTTTSDLCIKLIADLSVYQQNNKFFFQIKIQGKTYNFEINGEYCQLIATYYKIFDLLLCANQFLFDTNGEVKGFNIALKVEYPWPTFNTNTGEILYKRKDFEVVKQPIKIN